VSYQAAAVVAAVVKVLQLEILDLAGLAAAVAHGI
jgi:hypothetical protein